MKNSADYRAEIFTRMEEMLPCYELLLQLGHDYSREQYAAYLDEMIPMNYRQLVIKNGDKIVGLSGFWVSTKLFGCRYVELDNVVVDKDYRSEGIGHLLCKEVEEIAAREGCKMAVLDAYVINKGAHHFYFREGYHIIGFHFHKKL